MLNSDTNLVIYRLENFKISFKFKNLDFIVPRKLKFHNLSEGSLILLFEIFSIESILELFRCILLERKILIHSYHPSLIHSFLEAILSVFFCF